MTTLIPFAVLGLIAFGILFLASLRKQTASGESRSGGYGPVLSPEIVTVQIEKQAQANQIANSPAGGIVALGVFLVFILLCSGIFSTNSSTRPSAQENYTAAQKVTYLDDGNFDVAATARIQECLTRLSRKYGLNEGDVAGKLLMGQELLARDSVRMTVQQIADSIEAAAPRTTAVTFDEILATYTTLRAKNTDAQAIAQMRALFADLGLHR